MRFRPEVPLPLRVCQCDDAGDHGLAPNFKATDIFNDHVDLLADGL